MRTPTKWEISEEYSDESHLVIDPGSGLGCICIERRVDDKGEDMKMAQLISAAPELLEACKHALRVCESEERHEASEAIRIKALLISDLISAMRKAGLPYKDMTI